MVTAIPNYVTAVECLSYLVRLKVSILFLIPSYNLSKANSRSSYFNNALLLFTACMAAVLIIFLISAPVYPILLVTKLSMFIALSNLVFPKYNLNKSLLPLISGDDIYIILSNLPGRLRAGSRLYSRFVAATTRIFPSLLNPSISVRI